MARRHLKISVMRPAMPDMVASTGSRKHATNRWREIKTAEAAKAVLTVAMDRREAKRNAKAAQESRGKAEGRN